MAPTFRARFLGIQRRNASDMARLFADLSAQISAELIRRADADGNVPRTATLEIQRFASDRVLSLFLGRNARGERSPFEVLADGRVVPLSPYMRVLWPNIVAAVELPVEQQAALMRQWIPDDVLAVMQRAMEDPFLEATGRTLLAEMEGAASFTSGGVIPPVREIEVFRPNPLAQYDAPHTWVDPNGYQLSDRVWNVAGQTRQQIDLYLEIAIREGRGALAMSRELEQFLRPDRVNLKTKAPYGTSASYDAMRLARTEITRAHGQALQASAAMNPFVEGVKWNLSPSHPRTDRCDDRARGGPAKDGVYSLGEVPRYPDHPQCLCYLTNVITDDSDATIEALRDDIRRTRKELVDKVGPAKVEEFTTLLLGRKVESGELPTVAPLVIQPSSKLQPIPKPSVDLIEATGIPDLDQLAFVKKLGGSPGAELYEDASGKRYVVKSGASNAHIQSEFLADELYRTLGANVPRARLVEVDGKSHKIAEFVEGRMLGSLSGAEREAANRELQKHFVADALLASWDVIGISEDNVLVDDAGRVWRIDNGGSLTFEERGGAKEVGRFLDEIWTLRDKEIDPQAAEVFGNMSYGDIASQLTALSEQRRDILGLIEDIDLRERIAARFTHATDLAQIYETMSNDKYVDHYIDRFSYHSSWIQSAGLTDFMPKQLRGVGEGRQSVLLFDENGKEWDSIRGDGGIYDEFLNELDQRDRLAVNVLDVWGEQQAGDSWSAMPRYVKQLLAEQRPSEYYVPEAEYPEFMERAISNLRLRFSDERVIDTAAALNALSYETLRRVDMGNRPAPGLIRLLRTESKDVLKAYGIKKVGDKGEVLRGAAESTSLVSPVVVEGGYLTEQDVPLHRVIGMYTFGVDETIYLNDEENELLALLDGADVEFTRVIKER